MKRAFIVVLFVMAGVLRLINLGYSDYQGDEIKALYNPKEVHSINFFLEQRKGPMQFLVTAGLKGLTPDYRNRLLLRLPFALAGLCSVIVFFLIVRRLFNDKVAFYSLIFIATNGFFVAFSRLVQYQSLVILFGLLAIYLTSRYMDYQKPKFIVLASVSLSLSLLAHYDGIFFGPIILGLLLSKKIIIKHLAVAVSVFLIMTGTFYLPFVSNIAKSTTDYWTGRITGEVSGKISSSRYLFSVYQPIYVLHLYTVLGIIGLVLAVLHSVRKAPPHTIFNRVHGEFKSMPMIFLLLWFAIPFVLLEKFIAIPGTHIYTYLIPGFLLVGFALFYLELILNKFIKKLSVPYFVGIFLMTVFLFLQSYYIFVDHSVEYPWENKKFLLWTLPKPTPIFHLSMFGFPYYRYWDNVGDYIKVANQSDFYTTNERVSISRYHIDLVKDGERAGYYVYVSDPQTFTNEILNERISRWVTNNEPEIQFSNGRKVVTRIYLVK